MPLQQSHTSLTGGTGYQVGQPVVELGVAVMAELCVNRFFKVTPGFAAEGQVPLRNIGVGGGMYPMVFVTGLATLTL